jgi:hypothetical protein
MPVCCCGKCDCLDFVAVGVPKEDIQVAHVLPS